MDSDNRRFLIMGGIAVVILIAVFIYTLSMIFGPEDTSDQGMSSFPESGDRVDILPQEDVGYVPFTASSTSDYSIGTTSSAGAEADTLMDSVPDILRDRENTDWRDPVLSFSGQEVGVTESASNESGANSQTGSPYTSDTLFRDTGLMPDYPDASLFYPKTVTLGDGTVIDLEDALDLDKFTEATNPIPSLTDEFKGVQSCGKIQMKTSDIDTFLNRLHEYEPVICLGEAVANDCEYAWAEVDFADDTSLWVYVARKEDGTCGTGNTYVENTVRLCDLADAMNLVTGTNSNFDEWAEKYSKDPGEMFAKLYTSDEANLDLRNLGLSCDLYSI
jgi:uncharacterized membrane protein